MNITAENGKPTKMHDITESIVQNDELVNELVFVVVDVQDDGKAAIEGRYGIVAFADNFDDLKSEIVDKVQEHFHSQFKGKIRTRQFVDTVINV